MANYTKYDMRPIIEKREALNLSLRQLAARCNLAASTIRGYEQGKFSPKLENIKKICEALDLPLSSVVMIEEIQTFSTPLEFAITWLHNGGGRQPGSIGRQAAAVVDFEMLNEAGQIKALELLDLLCKVPEYQKEK